LNIEFRAFDGPSDWGWINQQVGIKQCEDTGGIMAIDLDKNETVGACVMDNWTQNSVQCHFMVANPLVLKHKFLECCFDYMFNTCNVSRVYGLVPANNEKAVKLNTHMGFTVKARLDEAYEVGVDYLVMEMKRENCRFTQQLEAA
jgi:RimJ/RimL family protein N-acetyltransferase